MYYVVGRAGEDDDEDDDEDADEDEQEEEERGGEERRGGDRGKFCVLFPSVSLSESSWEGQVSNSDTLQSGN